MSMTTFSIAGKQLSRYQMTKVDILQNFQMIIHFQLNCYQLMAGYGLNVLDILICSTPELQEQQSTMCQQMCIDLDSFLRRNLSVYTVSILLKLDITFFMNIEDTTIIRILEGILLHTLPCSQSLIAEHSHLENISLD